MAMRQLGECHGQSPRDCRPVVGAPDQNAIRYVCTGVLLTFDRRNPALRSKWSTSVTVRRRREVCARSEVRNGREVCVQRAVETYEAREPKSGTLQVRRATS